MPKTQESVVENESSSNCEDGPGICSHLLTLFSIIMIIVCLPFSLFCIVKVVQVHIQFLQNDIFINSIQEYERAVIFRLGRLLTGGARGPGVFFVIPCVDVYEKIDLRTNTYEIPPQEVDIKNLRKVLFSKHLSLDFDQRQRNRVRQCHHVL